MYLLTFRRGVIGLFLFSREYVVYIMSYMHECKNSVLNFLICDHSLNTAPKSSKKKKREK